MSDPRGNPQATQPYARVDPLARPASDTAQPYPQMGVTFIENAVHYVCTLPGAVMHRWDGKKLAFLANIISPSLGILETKISQDIRFLDTEIEGGLEFVRRATEAEVEAYKMRMDPKGTITAQIRPQIEAQVRADLEAQIRAEWEAKMAAGDTAVINRDAAKIAGIDSGPAAAELKAGTATVVLKPDTPTVQASQQSELAAMIAAENAKQRPPITPVSTADIADAAAGGNTRK